MKTPLYYAIRRNLHNDVVAVTSEHMSGKWAGRYVKDNTVTHGRTYRYGQSDLMGKFDTQFAAEQKREQLATIADIYKEKRAVYEGFISNLFREESAEIERLMKRV